MRNYIDWDIIVDPSLDLLKEDFNQKHTGIQKDETLFFTFKNINSYRIVYLISSKSGFPY